MSEECEVSIMVKDREVMAQSTGSDQAARRGPNRPPGATRSPVEISGVQEDLLPKWRLHDRQGRHRVTRQPESPLLSESLEDLLDHGETGHDLVHIDDGGQVQTARATKDLDPNRCVDEEHACPCALSAGPVSAHLC